MISKYRNNELLWIDLESPEDHEIDYILEGLSIEENIKNKIKDIINKNFEYKSNHIFEFIRENKDNKVFRNKDIIFTICDNYIVTIHKEKILGLKDFFNELEINTGPQNQIQNRTSKQLITDLLKHLFIDLENQLINNQTKIKEIEIRLKMNRKKLKLFKISITILIIIILALIYGIIFI